MKTMRTLGLVSETPLEGGGAWEGALATPEFWDVRKENWNDHE